MKNLKEKILNSLGLALKENAKKTLLVTTSPETALCHGIPRLVINLKGRSNVTFWKNGKLTTINFPEKTWFYCSANGYLLHSNIFANEGISISYYGDYIRAMHISYDGITPPPTERDIYYHTNKGISQVGQLLINALDELALFPNQIDAAPYMMKALLKISINDIKNSFDKPEKYNMHAIWFEINTYIHANRTKPISRETVAQCFKLSPGYISHLFHTFSNTNFSNTLLQLRLEHAMILLKNSHLSVDEISFESGFNYTSYFIKRFKKHYGMTPYAYRKMNRKNQ